MLDRHLIRTQPDLVREGMKKKGMQGPLDELLKLDLEFRGIKSHLDNQRAEQNQASKSIGALMAEGKSDEAERAKSSVQALKHAIQDAEGRERELELEIRDLELRLPNIPHATVPVGSSAEENVVVREWGSKPEIEPIAHWDVAERLGLIDLARGAKIAGSGFVVYTGWGARLQRTLFNFMADHQTLKNGYREIYPPYIVNSASLIGTGQLPKFAEDLYKIEGEDLYLIPTAEVPVTNLYRDEILDGEQLTMKMAGFSGCFRKEAGAAGKDTRGIQRVHQFDKVELVKITKPEDSYDELESLTADAEQILQMLGLHYRVVLICSADMGFSNTKQYDLEVWAPGVGKYLEISSCSNFESFQARRANIRFRRTQGEKPEFVHVLNGSGLATPRLFASLLETYYLEGGLSIPEPLRPYMGTDRVVVG